MLNIFSCFLRGVISAVMSVVMFFGSLFDLGWQGCKTPLENMSELLVSNGNCIILERGFVLQTWAPAEASTLNAPAPGFFSELGFGPTFYDGNMMNRAYLDAEPDILWSLAKAPDADNGVTGSPTGAQWLSAEQLQYADRLVSVCFGDEQKYSIEQIRLLAEWFEDFRSRTPNVLLHINQYARQWNREQLTNYIRTAKPDLITFDDYYFSMSEGGKGKDYKVPAIVADTINEYRIPAMGGHDGSGEAPIPFGQYLSGFKTGEGSMASGSYEITQSQKNLAANLTASMGGKWLSIFRLGAGERNTTRLDNYFLLHNTDGTTTRHFDEYAEISRELENLSPHLTKLQTTDVRVAPGQHKWWLFAVDNSLPDSVLPFKQDAALHVKSISAANLGVQNDGLAGDVFLGKFAALPGTGLTNRDYFAVCNGLTQGNGLSVEEQHGSCDETRQEITLALDGTQTKTLYYVDETTGESLPAEVDNGLAVFTLGGGKMRLFFWE